MNILIKLTCLVGLVIAPILGEQYQVSQKQAPKIEQIQQPNQEIK